MPSLAHEARVFTELMFVNHEFFVVRDSQLAQKIAMRLYQGCEYLWAYTESLAVYFGTLSTFFG